MSKLLVSHDLWAAIELLLPSEPPKPRGGRPRCNDRVALAGVIFVLRSGIPWEMLPRELCCSGMTCWRRLRDWQVVGVWAGLHCVLLERLPDAGHLDWSRASLDSASVPAKRGPCGGVAKPSRQGLLTPPYDGRAADLVRIARRWRIEETGVQPQSGDDAETGAQRVQEINCRKAAIGDHHHLAVRQPARGLERHLPGPVGQQLMTLSMRVGVPLGGAEHRQKWQGPDASGP